MAKISCGGFNVGEGLTVNGNTLKAVASVPTKVEDTGLALTANNGLVLGEDAEPQATYTENGITVAGDGTNDFTIKTDDTAGNLILGTQVGELHLIISGNEYSISVDGEGKLTATVVE